MRRLGSVAMKLATILRARGVDVLMTRTTDTLIALSDRGRIANTAGDSVLAEFASVLDAVHCAVEIQEALARANEGEPEGRQMRFRIGVNVGDSWSKRATSSATA